MTDVQRLLDVLRAAGVDFVIVGGVALVLRGSARVTLDLDLCYARDRGNLRRLAGALAPYHPRLRGAPTDLPFLWDERTLASGLNFTLTTDLGDLDILGEVTGVGTSAKLLSPSSPRALRTDACPDGPAGRIGADTADTSMTGVVGDDESPLPPGVRHYGGYGSLPSRALRRGAAQSMTPSAAF